MRSINTSIDHDDLRDAFEQAVKGRTIEIYSGSASGNNTVDQVMGVYDLLNDPVIYFGFTNCGSDD